MGAPLVPPLVPEDEGSKYIAKFFSSCDLYSVVKAEYLAMRLVALASGWTRKSMVSALTLFGLDEMMARYASYEELAEIIRHRFTQPRETLKELFGRLVFNVLCGNSDDHARNHAAFGDGKERTLKPAYDICPQGRTGNEAAQAMLITGTNRFSQIKTCLAATHHFLLSRQAAVVVIDRIETAIRGNWERVCEAAELSPVEQSYLWKRQFFNPFSAER